MKILLRFLIAFILFAVPSWALASTSLYFSPDKQEVGPNDTFSVDLLMDVADDCVNTIEGVVVFPKDLELRDFMVGESIISIWVDAPRADEIRKVNDDGVLRFSGGIPGGYCGAIAGDPGLSNLVGKLVFATPKRIEGGAKTVNLEYSAETKVYLNDGLGTIGELSMKKAEIGLSENQRVKNDSLGAQIGADNIMPEPFVVEFHRSDQMFDGKFYIIFNTVDKQTGVDHYEVLEIRSEEEIGGKTKRNLVDYLMGIKRAANVQWKTADMPHVLEDQSLQSIVKVKAVDKAGNERVIEYVPPQQAQDEIKLASKRRIIVVLLWVGGALLAALFAFVASRVMRRRNGADKDGL